MSELAKITHDPFLCERCEARYAQRGICAKCADEPLLDLNDLDARELLLNHDRKRFMRRSALFLAIGVVVSLFLIALLTALLTSDLTIVSAILLGSGLYIYVCGFLFIALTIGIERLLIRAFPARSLAHHIQEEAMRDETSLVQSVMGGLNRYNMFRD